MAEDAIEAKLASRGLLPVAKVTPKTRPRNLIGDLPVVLGVLFKHVQLIALFQSKDLLKDLKTPLNSTSQKSLEPEGFKVKIISRR